MNISFLKAFFRTMLLTVLISPSILSAARLANQQPPQYFYSHTLSLIDRPCGQVAHEWVGGKVRKGPSSAGGRLSSLIAAWNKGTCCGKPTSTFPFGEQDPPVD